MRTQKERIIDGTKFVVTAFPAADGFELKFFLLNKFGPSLGLSVGAFGGDIPTSGKVGDKKVDSDKISQTIEKLMGQLGPGEPTALLKTMFLNVVAHIEGKQYHFTAEKFNSSMDIVFGGRLFNVYQVLLLVLEANYPDFLSKIGGIGMRIKTMLSLEPEEENSMSESNESETSED